MRSLRFHLAALTGAALLLSLIPVSAQQTPPPAQGTQPTPPPATQPATPPPATQPPAPTANAAPAAPKAKPAARKTRRAHRTRHHRRERRDFAAIANGWRAFPERGRHIYFYTGRVYLCRQRAHRCW